MSIFPIPASVASRLEKLMRDFLWGGLGDDQKMHLVRWEKACVPLKYGGLGFRKLALFNQALMGKWLWRYSREEDALWRRIIDGKYGIGEGGWCSGSLVGSYGVSVWRYIRRGWDSFYAYVSFVIGNGLKVSFWSDKWCGDVPLRMQFPMLFQLARNKDAKVSEYLEYRDGQVTWSPVFLRAVQDWEISDFLDFLKVLYAGKVRGNGGDVMRWSVGRKGIFEVKTFYKELSKSGRECSFPWKSIWKAKVPKRVAFFVWVAAHDKVLTIDNLTKRGFMLVNRCSLCKESGETVDHLLLHCPFAVKVWAYFVDLFCISWVMPKSVLAVLDCWKTNSISKDLCDIWQQIPLAVMWGLWRERNSRVFEEEEVSVTHVIKSCVFNIYDWARAHGLMHCDSIPEFIGLLRRGQ